MTPRQVFIGIAIGIGLYLLTFIGLSLWVPYAKDKEIERQEEKLQKREEVLDQREKELNKLQQKINDQILKLGILQGVNK